MNIINKPKTYSKEEIDNELIKIVKESLVEEKATEFERTNVARAQASVMKNHKSVPGLGKCIGVMPGREYFRLVKKYGYETVHSKDFMRFFNKKMPELSPNRV
jgi:hypothetical protein